MVWLDFFRLVKGFLLLEEAIWGSFSWLDLKVLEEVLPMVGRKDFAHRCTLVMECKTLISRKGLTIKDQEGLSKIGYVVNKGPIQWSELINPSRFVTIHMR